MHRAHFAVAFALGLAAFVVTVGGVAWLGSARAGDPLTAKDDLASRPVDRALAAGRHLRIDGPRGPIHVWIPAGYQADTGATVLYLHGYYDNVDTAWTGHQLAQQFALSSLNAIFVAPEAPVSNRGDPNYPDLGEIMRLVEDASGVPRGAAFTAAIGHSGAFRTFEAWLDEPLLDELVSLDAMYGDEGKVIAWYKASPRHRLIMVGEDTVLGTESVASKLRETVTLDRFPPTFEMIPREARAARLLYIRAQFAHMPLVTEGVALPTVLRLLPIERLAEGPWQVPIGPPLVPVPDAGVMLDDAPTN